MSMESLGFKGYVTEKTASVTDHLVLSPRGPPGLKKSLNGSNRFFSRAIPTYFFRNRLTCRQAATPSAAGVQHGDIASTPPLPSSPGLLPPLGWRAARCAALG